MRPQLLLCLASLVSAAPKSGLRLIKTSPEDPGTWVTEEQKLTNYVAKDIHFVDITDVKDPEVLTAWSTPDGVPTIAKRAVTYPSGALRQSVANPLVAQASTTQPQSWLQTLTNYHNRYYRASYGTQAGTWLFNTVKSVASANSAITVSQFAHSFSQPSIIAKIPGSNSSLGTSPPVHSHIRIKRPANPNLLLSVTTVIVSAHYDSTAGSATARAPGADDNGSGVVVILEALRVLANANYAPKNTIEFHFYGGEEGGLLGSQAVFSNYKTAGKNVLAVVNQDMAGYSPSGKISIYTDYVDTALTTYTRSIATTYTGATTSDKCGYGCSDHASARSNGFREFTPVLGSEIRGLTLILYQLRRMCVMR